MKIMFRMILAVLLGFIIAGPIGAVILLAFSVGCSAMESGLLTIWRWARDYDRKMSGR